MNETDSSGTASKGFFDVFEKSIADLEAAQSSGAVTSASLVQAYLARIVAYDRQGPALNAVIALNPHAVQEAETLDRERELQGPRGPLHGIPVLVKDNYDTANMPTTGGALALATLQPATDAAQVERLRRAGAVILGKTTMHELAAGITNISSLTGMTRNPYHLDRVPGGSSGGSGVAVAASFAAAAMGSDTCGSIRIPAANQNLVGLRVSFGLASRAGVMPLSSSQDVVGPLARTVDDLAIMLDATVGEDSRDAATAGVAAHVPASYRDALKLGALEGKRLGVLGALFGTAAEDGEVVSIVKKSLDEMRVHGAEVVSVLIPSFDDLLAGSSAIPHEFKFVLADYLAGHPGAPVGSLGEIIAQGLHHEQLEHAFRLRNAPTEPQTEAAREALARRRTLRQAVLAVFEAQQLDALVYPTLQREAAPLGLHQAGPTCQLSASTGLPAISFPAGFTASGVPVGIEFLGMPFSEAKLLACAYDWEQTVKLRRPPYSTPPLVDGRAPAAHQARIQLTVPGTDATVGISLTYEAHTSTLSAEIEMGALAEADLIALTIQRGLPDQPGPVLEHLRRAGWPSRNATLTLRAPDREALRRGELYVHLYTRQAPLGASRASINF